MFISSRAVLNSMEKLSAPIDPTSRSSISYCRTRTMLISRQSWTNGSASITSQDHMEPLQEKRLTKRSGKGYDSLIRCLADWSILQLRIAGSVLIGFRPTIWSTLPTLVPMNGSSLMSRSLQATLLFRPYLQARLRQPCSGANWGRLRSSLTGRPVTTNGQSRQFGSSLPQGTALIRKSESTLASGGILCAYHHSSTYTVKNRLKAPEWS